MPQSVDRLRLKVIGGLVCLYENGWAYTWYHGLTKIGNALKRYGTRHLHYREVRRKDGSANYFTPRQFIRPPHRQNPHVVALFAMYNPDGRVSDAVWIYLKGLREVADEVVVCSDSAICADDVARLKSIASSGIFTRHGEYDFGSFKRAYQLAEDNGYLRKCKMLIMANDSCVGPVFPLARMLEHMADSPCDFWGQTSYSFHGRPHVQSYFVAFSEKIVSNGALGEFFKALPVCRTRADVISSCEIALTEFLSARGFKWGSYVPYRAVLKNPMGSPCLLMTKYFCPLVKVKALMGEAYEPLKTVRDTVKEFNPVIYDAFIKISSGWEPV